MGLVATGTMATLAAMATGAGCSSSGSGSGPITLRGEYDATETGDLLAITFLDATTYTVKRSKACSESAFCVEHGTYTVDSVNSVLTLKSSSGATQSLPYSVLTSAPLTQSVARQLHLLGDSLTSGSDAALNSGSDAGLTVGADAALTGDAGNLVVEINIALTITLGGQGVAAGAGSDNCDAGGNTDGGTPLGFDGGVDLGDSGDNGTNEPDAWVEAGSLTSDDGGVDLGGGDAAADGSTGDSSTPAADGGSSSSGGSSAGSSASGGSSAASSSKASSAAGGGGSSAAGGGSGTGASSGGGGASDAGLCGGGNVNEQSSNATWSAYQPSKAITYADANWSNGVGLCAQFTSASVTAGGVKLSYTWVPDIVTALSGVAYDEYSPSNTNVNAAAGDIVVYSNATGNSFCQTHSVNERNCGHVGLVVTAGTAATATADFHNGAHHHLGIKYILEGTTVSPTSPKYSTFRVYHVAALASSCGS